MPWAPPRGSDPTSPASTASSSATEQSQQTRRDPGDLAPPHKRPSPQRGTSDPGPSGSSPKRIKLDTPDMAEEETVSVESVALRLAFDSCVKRISQTITNLQEEGSRLPREGTPSQIAEGKGKKPLDGPGSSLLLAPPPVAANMAQVRLAATELTSLVAQAGREELGDRSDQEYGEKAKSKVLQRASELDKGIYEELKRILYPR